MSSMALDFAQETGDETLISYILMRRSNIATDAKRPELALKLADAALDKMPHLPPRSCAVALRQRAHAFAQLDQSDDCANTLDWRSNSLSEAPTRRRSSAVLHA